MNVVTLSTSYSLAERSHGVCRGTLWLQKQLKGKPTPRSFLTASASDKTTCDYCILTGVHLRCYESNNAYSKGDAMITSLQIVGVSAWNPASDGTQASSFRLVTDQGTHVYCQAPSKSCRDVWLNAFRTGLELALEEPILPTLPRPQPQKYTLKRTRLNPRHCFSCGAVEGGDKTLLGPACPLQQYGKEARVEICVDCFTAQGLLDHIEFVRDCLASTQQERKALLQAKQICRQVRESAPVSLQLVAENEHLHEATDEQHSSSTGSWDHIAETQNTSDNESSSRGTPSPPEVSWLSVENEPGSKALMDLLNEPTSELNAVAKSSPFLSTLATHILKGQIGSKDFHEEIDEAIGQHESGGMAALKKEAFKMAGDMGTAMKMLVDHAIPRDRESQNTEVLTCILDFFLDLNEDEEMSSVAFFWQQLCQIHLRMLPAENAADLVRIELMEDFLLTVACKYSVHLALELTWSHTADLEDSLSTNTSTLPSSTYKRRRFAIMRFLCELESLLFDAVDRFGSGTVALGKMFAPTVDQMERMRKAMFQIQDTRERSGCRLARSYRHEKLSNLSHDMPAELAVQEKLRIARNADYYSSHLNFTKRICDIADRLRHMEVEERSAALAEELHLLNSSGAMGGDPLNAAQKDLCRVVRVPSTEGHVFRSKERTPVLLLMEIVSDNLDEAVEDQDEMNSTPSDEALAMQQPDDESAGLVVTDAKHGEELADLEENDKVETSIGCVVASSIEAFMEFKPTVPACDVLQGSFQHSDPTPRSPKAAALLRFDGNDRGGAPPTPKKDVEELLTTVMAQHMRASSLDLPELPLPPAPPKDEESIAMERATIFRGVKEAVVDVAESEQPVARIVCEKLQAKRSFARTRSNDGSHALAPTGDIRREVLNAIMIRGMEGNTIAAGTADSVTRSLQELERRQAMELLVGDIEKDDGSESNDVEGTREKLVSMGITATMPANEVKVRRSEEDEVMESIRLLLIQHRVAQGKLSPADAAKVLQHTSISRTLSDSRISERAARGLPLDRSDCPTVEAGDIDRRLVGCGPLPPAVLQALTLWKGEMVSSAELLELVKKDILFVKHSVLYDAENAEKLVEDSDFWGRFAFGERWAEKKARLAAVSPVGMIPGWDLQGVIVKSNDDLRQEQFIMQLIELSQEALELAGLELWISPYRILATGRSTGVVEMVRNAMSFDALKKRPGYGKGGLREHLCRMCEFTADPIEALKAAQLNFVRSLAAYSLISYLFLVKDRHNGNLLLDTAGHVIHIDFGFVFGKAPGGSFSLEMYSPFKLTEEMLDVMGGLKSPLFSEFVTLFCCGFLALQSYAETFLTIVEIMCSGSTFKCFEGRAPDEIVDSLRERFCLDKSKEETVAFALDLISQAATSYGTRQYDLFQYMSQGIAA
ncbi:hypothetical protein MPSEU_000742900 [Mayamaea pseudoterrestris]|nr:hypothetical protein MPSEU_000742900 [Mayamaea pseudoterrestris]